VPPAVCRICHSGDTSCAYNSSMPGEVLISPCLCKGTTGLYHRSCLERWLITSATTHCEICQFVFDVHKKNRGFCTFLFNTESYFQRRNMLSDFVCFLILTPLAGLTCTICVKGIAELSLDYSSFKMQDIPNLLWLSGLIFLLIVTYTVWLIVTVIHHRRTFLEWQKYNQKLVVVDQLSEQESFLVNKCIMSLLGSMNALRKKFRVSMNATSHSHSHSSTVETGPEILATVHRPISRRFSSRLRYSHPELPCISEVSDELSNPDSATVSYVTLLQSVNIHRESQGNPV